VKVLGIDPGKLGAAVLLHDNGQIAEIWDAPIIKIGTKRVYDATAMADIFIGLTGHPTHVAIEKVGARPKQGVTSMFQFGLGCGLWQGMIALARLPVTFYTPQAWKKGVLAGMPPGKGASLVRAKQLWPTCTGFNRAKDEGRAEAALIAHHHQLQVNRHA
jgi:crossover junction endodeoxyribonuclease RuvC